MSEFGLLETKLEGGKKEVLGAFERPSVLVLARERARMKAALVEYGLSEGRMFFVTHDVEISLEAGDAGLEIYSALLE
jgi:hypothetical protein